MTIDSAISDFEKMMKHQEDTAAYNIRHGGTEYAKMAKANKKKAFEYQQLAEWLKELKRLRDQTRLIPVSERMPQFTICNPVVGKQFTEDVLVYDGDEFRIGYLAKNTMIDFCYWVVYGEDVFEPIAWMPLPEPYKASPTGEEVGE